MFLNRNGECLGSELDAKPEFVGKEVIVAVDGSKRNSGICIEDLETKEEISYAMNGEYDGTTEQDCMELCRKQRYALKTILKDSFVRACGIEDIITKEYGNKGHKTGMTVHSSRFKITSVFASFVDCFQDSFNKTPILINNWAWKAAILPPQFREKDVVKGSILYAQSIGHPFGSLTDDETDAWCMKQYLKRYLKSEILQQSNSTNLYDGELQIKIVDKSHIDEVQIYQYDTTKDFNTNCRHVVADTKAAGNVQKVVGIIAQVDCIPLQILWKFIDDKFNNSSNVAIVILGYL